MVFEPKTPPERGFSERMMDSNPRRPGATGGVKPASFRGSRYGAATRDDPTRRGRPLKG
jgi:hypothetical protein